MLVVRMRLLWWSVEAVKGLRPGQNIKNEGPWTISSHGEGADDQLDHR
jgi:hypothetical protein